MGFSEEVSTDGLLATIDAGGIHIEQFDPTQPELPPVDLGAIDLKPLQAEFCDVELGCVVGVGGSTAGALSSLAGAASTRDITSSLRSSGASRWVDLTVANPPAPGSQVRLTLAAGAFEDLFQNPSTDGVVEEFTWGPGETVLLDATPPRVRAVRLLGGHLEIELNEEPELGTAQAAIDVGQPATWALSADGLTLRSEASLLAGSYTLTIQPTLADRAGLNLQQLFELSLLIPAIEPNAVFFEEPDPQEVASSSVGNLYGLHGLPRDPESGLVYARNRYYDPELGRFVTADPLGYVDGPNSYQFALNSPVNYSDPMGLDVVVSPVSGSFTLSDLETGSAQTFTLGNIEIDWGSFEAALRAATNGDDEYDRYRGEVSRQFQLRAVRRYLKDPNDVKGAVAHEQSEHPPMSGRTFCNVATRHIAGAEARSPGLAKKWGGCADYYFSFEISKNAGAVLGSSSDQLGKANRIYDRLVSGTAKDRGPWVEVRPSQAQQVANMGGLAFAVQRNYQRTSRGAERSGHIAVVVSATDRERFLLVQSLRASVPGKSHWVSPMIGNVGAHNVTTLASHAFAVPYAGRYSEVHYFVQRETLWAAEAYPYLEDR